MVIDRAVFRKGTDLEESIDVDQLSPIGTKGGVSKISELALAIKSMSLASAR